MNLKAFYCNSFREATYLISDEAGTAAVIDCGCYTPTERERLRKYIEEHNLHLTHHLLTHAHLDHLCGANFIYEHYGVLPHLSAADKYYFDHQYAQAEAFGMPLLDETIKQYIPVTAYEEIQVGTLLFRALPTPGHTRGGMSYYCQQHQLVFSGDVLFYESIGRSDMPQGSFEDLINGIRQQLLTLPDETIVYPGHGLDTTIEHEKQYNPYI